MKIKNKKQLNLPQLIEWAWDNEVKGKTFYARETGMENVHFNTSGRAEFSNVHQFSLDDYFTVEEEIEITKDTPFKKLFLITNDSVYSEMYYNYSINDVLSDNEGYYQELAILIMYPEPKIIWTHDKGLVE